MPRVTSMRQVRPDRSTKAPAAVAAANGLSRRPLRVSPAVATAPPIKPAVLTDPRNGLAPGSLDGLERFAPDRFEDGRLDPRGGLDPGIRHFVLILRSQGIETCQSCQGGPGHAYTEPTIEFSGEQAEGPRAIAAAITYGLPVDELRRQWTVRDGEIHGPIWTMTFRLRADVWLKREEDRTRVDAAQLSRYGNVEERAFVPVDIAMDLDRLAGGNPLLAAWAQVAGFELVPNELHARASRLIDHVATIARDMSAVVAEIAEPKDDTPARAREIETAAAEAVDALEQLRNDCRRVIAGQPAAPAPQKTSGA